MRVCNGSDESEIGIGKRPVHTVFKTTQTPSKADATGCTDNSSTTPRKPRPQLCGVCQLDVEDCEKELKSKKREKACLDALNKRREEACGELMFVLLLVFLGVCTVWIYRAGGRDEQGAPVSGRYRSVLARALGL